MADSSFILDFVASFDKATKNLETFTKDVSKTVKQIEKDFGQIKLAGFVTGLNQGIELAKKLGNALAEPIKQAAEFEQDVNNLRIALDATGQATDKTVNGFIDYAAALQETTKFFRQCRLTTASLIQNLSQLSGRELKGATKAALDLSTALGIDLNSAASLVGKAANGNVAAFKRYGIEVKKGTTDSETFANALLLISRRFGGSSEKSVNTFAGAISQLKNNFDDSLKTFGLVIIQNKSVVETIQLVSSGFIGLTKSIKDNEGVLGNIINKGFLVLNAVLKNIVPLLSVAALSIIAYGASVAASTISVLGFTGALQYSTIGLRAFAVSAYAAIVPLLPFIAVGALVAGVTAFAVKIFLIRDGFVSFKDAAKAAALEVGIFVTEFLGLTSIAERFKSLLDGLRQKKIDLDTGDAQANIDKLIEGAKSYRKNLDEAAKEREIAATKERAQFEETATANFDKIKEALAKAGKSEFELLVTQKDEQLKILKDYGSLGEEQSIVANKLRLNVETEFNNKRDELNKKSNEFYIQEADKAIAKQKELSNSLLAAGASIPAFIKGLDDLKKKGASQGELVASGAAAVAGSIVQGAEGARQAVVELGTQAAVAAFGPLGELARPLLDAFSKGPEEVKKLVTEFLGAIPGIIQNIILAIPAFVIAFVQAIPTLIDGLLSAIPVVIEELVNSIPILIDTLVALQPRITQAFIDNVPAIVSALAFLMPQVAVTLTSALISQAPAIGIQMAVGFIQQIPTIVAGIAEGVKNAISSLGGSLGGGGGGLLGKVINPVASIGKKLKFAEGGVVPNGFANDTFNAKLTSGEGIIPVDTMRRLDQYLSAADGRQSNNGGGGTTIIKLVVGEQELANVMLSLNQRGFRMN